MCALDAVIILLSALVIHRSSGAYVMIEAPVKLCGTLAWMFVNSRTLTTAARKNDVFQPEGILLFVITRLLWSIGDTVSGNSDPGAEIGVRLIMAVVAYWLPVLFSGLDLVYETKCSRLRVEDQKRDAKIDGV